MAFFSQGAADDGSQNKNDKYVVQGSDDSFLLIGCFQPRVRFYYYIQKGDLMVKSLLLLPLNITPTVSF